MMTILSENMKSRPGWPKVRGVVGASTSLEGRGAFPNVPGGEKGHLSAARSVRINIEEAVWTPVSLGFTT
jgi:hypothetical protein